MLVDFNEDISLRGAFRRQRRVILALMLRNMRTRYFGSGLGFLLAIAWPLSHILIFIAVSLYAGRHAPVGESAALFFGTGSATFMAFSYLAQFTMQSLLATRPLLGFPEVKLLDVVLAAAALEVLSAFTVTLILLTLGYFFGVNIMPRNIEDACAAYGSAILLGLGVGILNSLMAMQVPMWSMIFALSRITLWLASGVIVLPDSVPEPLRTMMSYNPVAQSVEWMRSAYFEGVGYGFLDRAYTIKFGLVAVFLGLLIERVTRGYLLR
jgi:capsular polysaccharide transport system permease protein